MTERKPPFLPWERFIERQIREAEEAGQFDNLPGAGKPLPGLDQSYDELWWLKNWLKREGLSLVPESLQTKREVEQFLENIHSFENEDDLLTKTREINRKILDIHRNGEGPAPPPRLLDPDIVIRTWREKRNGAAS